MTQPLLQIPLDIPDVQVEAIETTPKGEFIIKVSSTLASATCHQCGKRIDKFYSFVRHKSIATTQIY